jgi:hypothetical protein
MRLICFGDSWTAGHGVDEDVRYSKFGSPKIGAGFINKLRQHNGWPRWLANKLNCPYVIFAECGYSNENIVNDIEEVVNSDMLKNDDIIVTMMSFPYRDDIGPIQNFNKMEKLLKPYVHFYVNSFYPTFLNEEDYDISQLPSYFINPSGSITDYLTDYEIENDKSIWEYGWRNRKDKPKFSYDSYHPNLDGYKLVAEYLYNQIKDVYIEMIDNNKKINNKDKKII